LCRLLGLGLTFQLLICGLTWLKPLWMERRTGLRFKDLARMKGYATVFVCVQPLIQTREKAAPSEPRIATLLLTLGNGSVQLIHCMLRRR